MKARSGVIKLLLLAIAVLTATGCARTVTSIVDFGSTLMVEVNLQGTLDVNTNRYFLVLGSNSGFKVPLPSPGVDLETPELVEPGTAPIIGSVEAYYSKYFTTWSGYVFIDLSGYTLVSGPFVQGVTATREALGNITLGTNKMSFTVNLSKVFGSTIPDNIYFDVISVPWPDGGAKVPADHLTSTDTYIAKISGSVITVTDDEDPGILPSQDIRNCRFEVQ